MKRYFITGWSCRLGRWEPELIEARTKVAAKERFVALYPSLKRIKAYQLA